MKQRISITIVLTAAVLFQSGVVWADGISTPSYCPPGTQPDGCHWDGYCAILDCDEDSDCSGGRVCRAIEYCMGTASCYHNPREPDAGTSGRPDYRGLCGEGEACDGRCETHRACVDSDDPEFGGETGCDCRAGGRWQGRTAAVVSLLIGFLAFVRLRSRG